MSDEAPSRQQDKFVLRLPDGMRDKIAEAAESAGRSMNAEIVQRLEAGFEADGRRAEVLEALKTLSAATAAIGEYKARQDRLLSKTAWYLREVVDRVPQDDATTKAVMAGIRGFANALYHGEFEEAAKPLNSLIDLGIDLGIVDPETREAREPWRKLADSD